MEHCKPANLNRTLQSSAEALTITIGFQCNNDCLCCMLRGIRGKLTPVTFEQYKEILTENSAKTKSSLLILSGAEVTLNHDLLQFVEYARDLNSFANIRIQTNGRKLSNIDYCRKLVASGVNEYFLSLHGHNEDVHEDLTQSRGSFRETLSGIENLSKMDTRILTNTVVTRRNYFSLPEIVDLVSNYPNVLQMQFWMYWPMSPHDKYDLLESYLTIRQYLVNAMTRGEERQIPTVVKGFPECLLGPYAHHLDNSQPRTILDDFFWKLFDENSTGTCIHKSKCTSQECKGLIPAYIDKFPWDMVSLAPFLSKSHGK